MPWYEWVDFRIERSNFFFGKRRSISNYRTKIASVCSAILILFVTVYYLNISLIQFEAIKISEEFLSIFQDPNNRLLPN